MYRRGNFQCIQINKEVYKYMTTLVIDIDDTLLKSEKDQNGYCGAEPIRHEIETVNKFFDKGYTIILHTGRNWDKYSFTKEQLAHFGIKHHELVMGKPQGYYIDKDSFVSMEDFLVEKGIV